MQDEYLEPEDVEEGGKLQKQEKPSSSISERNSLEHLWLVSYSDFMTIMK